MDAKRSQVVRIALVTFLEAGVFLLILTAAMLAVSFWFSDGTPLYDYFPDARLALFVLSFIYLACSLLMIRGKQALEHRLKIGDKAIAWLTIVSAALVIIGFLPTLIALVSALTTSGRP